VLLELVVRTSEAVPRVGVVPVVVLDRYGEGSFAVGDAFVVSAELDELPADAAEAADLSVEVSGGFRRGEGQQVVVYRRLVAALLVAKDGSRQVRRHHSAVPAQRRVQPDGLAQVRAGPVMLADPAVVEAETLMRDGFDDSIPVGADVVVE
jgi:hypothetical protein